jgi:hypothetical protein
MTRTEIVTVAIRLAAVLFLVHAIQLVTGAWALHGLAGGTSYALPVIVDTAVLFALSVLTWVVSGPLAELVLPAPDPGVPVISIGRQDLEAVAIRIVGLLFALWGVVAIAYSIVYGLIRSHAPGMSMMHEIVDARGGAELGKDVVQLALGLWLFLGKAGIRRTLEKIRGTGPDEPAGPPEEGGA